MSIAIWWLSSRRESRRVHLAVGISSAAVMLLALTPEARAQQLEPRAYSSSPVGMNFIGLAVSYTSGGVLTDPSLPVENVNAKIPSVAPFYLRTFDLFGRVANVQLVVP